MKTVAIQHQWRTLLFLAAFLAGSAACGQSTRSLIQAEVGQKFYVILPVTAGTGSEWKWEEHPFFRVRRLGSNETQSLGIGAEVPGGESAEVDEVVGSAPGRFVLHWRLLLYPWAAKPQVIDHRDVTVIVKSQQ